MPGPDDIQPLIGAIYDAALDPARWDDCLAELAERVGLVVPGAAWVSVEPPTSRGAHPRDIDESFLTAFDERYGDLLAAAVTRAGPRAFGRAIRIADVAPTSRIDDWEFFSDWMRPQGLRLGAACWASVDGTLVGVGGYREANAPDFAEAELELLDLLTPHVARAEMLAHRLGAVAEQRDVLAAALDRLSTAVVLLDGEGRVRGANATAEALAAQRDGLRLAPERLTAEDPGAQRALTRRVRQACGAAHGDGAGAGGALALPRPSGRRPYELWVCPLPASSLRLAGEAGAALVFLADPEERAEPPEALLRRVHGLTPAEARLAARLATGEALADAADALGVARETARNQLKQVFLKTDTHRQAELVALLLRGAAGLAPPGCGPARRGRER